MITEITFIFDSPNDPASFETDNPGLLARAKAIPGFQGIRVSCVRTGVDLAESAPDHARARP